MSGSVDSLLKRSDANKFLWLAAIIGAGWAVAAAALGVLISLFFGGPPMWLVFAFIALAVVSMSTSAAFAAVNALRKRARRRRIAQIRSKV